MIALQRNIKCRAARRNFVDVRNASIAIQSGKFVHIWSFVTSTCIWNNLSLTDHQSIEKSSVDGLLGGVPEMSLCSMQISILEVQR